MRLLVADDSPTIQTLLRTLLERAGHEVTIATDGAEALAILTGEQPPQLAILDWTMPELNGPEVCRRLRAARSEPYIHVILLTAREGRLDPVEGLDAGADDYLRKPFQPEELEARVRSGCRVLELERQLRAARDALRWEAQHDPLTMLFNRRAAEELLRMEWARAQRTQQPFALAFIDLDHFKHVNDTYGHAAGDAALAAAAAQMKAVVRPYDCLGRYGGEEFILGLPGCTRENALAVAERVRRAIEESPVVIEGHSFGITASIGVAATESASAGDVSALIHLADEAVYRAKDAGRNRVEAA